MYEQGSMCVPQGHNHIMLYCENPVHRGIIFFLMIIICHFLPGHWLYWCSPLSQPFPRAAKPQQETIHDIWHIKQGPSIRLNLRAPMSEKCISWLHSRPGTFTPQLTLHLWLYVVLQMFDISFQCLYRGADMSLARPGRKQATATEDFEFHISYLWQSQWPRGLRRRSTAIRLLRLLVRIPSRAWMCVCCECCALSGRGPCDGLIIRSEESYQLWRITVCDHENSQARRLKPVRGL